jgi:hypothetical protein
VSDYLVRLARRAAGLAPAAAPRPPDLSAEPMLTGEVGPAGEPPPVETAEEDAPPSGDVTGSSGARKQPPAADRPVSAPRAAAPDDRGEAAPVRGAGMPLEDASAASIRPVAPPAPPPAQARMAVVDPLPTPARHPAFAERSADSGEEELVPADARSERPAPAEARTMPEPTSPRPRLIPTSATAVEIAPSEPPRVVVAARRDPEPEPAPPLTPPSPAVLVAAIPHVPGAARPAWDAEPAAARQVEPSIEVHIGRIELVQPQPPETPAAAAPRAPRGFNGQEAARRHLDRRWY